MSCRKSEMTGNAVTMNVGAWFRGTVASLVEAGWDARLAQEEVASAVRWAAKQVPEFDGGESSFAEAGVLEKAGPGPVGEVRRAAFTAIAQDVFLFPSSAKTILELWCSTAEHFNAMKVTIKELKDGE